MRVLLPLLVLALGAVGVALGVAGACDNGDARLDRARDLLDEGRFADAREAIVAAHGERPAAVSVATLLARAHRECGRPEEALAVLAQISDQDARRDEVREEKARALHARALNHREFKRSPGRSARAAQDMSEASRLALALAEAHRKDPSLLLLAGRIQLESGRRGAARTWFEEARLRGADRVVCEALEAQATAQAGNRTDARSRLQTLTREHPEHAEALWALGTLRRSTGDRPEARRLLERAIAADPLHPSAGLDLARTLRELGDEEGAANAARRFLDRRPDHLGALRTLAHARGSQQRWSEAIEALEHAAATHVRDADVLDELGMALAEGAGWKNERTTAAIRTHEKGLAIDPRHVGNAYNLARALVTWNRTEKLERAVRVYEELLARIQDRPEYAALVRDIHRNVGLVLSDSFKLWTRAFEHYRAYFLMGGEVTPALLDEWGKVLEGRGVAFREPPRPGD